MLTQERLKELLSYDPETGVFIRLVALCNRIKVGDVAGNLDQYGYRCIMVDRKSYMAHRLAWLYVFGVWPVDQIDHINCIKDDNRIINLREATQSQNMQNQRKPQKNGTSGFLGVTFFKRRGKWAAYIQVKNKKNNLGYFPTPELAHKAYIEAKRFYHAFGTL